jgi:hypothetical protein
MNLWKYLSAARTSKKVALECCICRKTIKYLFFPTNANEQAELYMFRDISQANICECGAIWHLRCSSRKQDQVNRQNRSHGIPGFGQVLQREMSREQLNLDSIRKALDSDTAALGCPRCGSFKSKVGFLTDDDSVIRVKGDKRVS